MDASFYSLVFAGFVLELCLIWRLSRQGMWRTYSYLLIYLLCVTLRTAAVPVIAFLAPARFPSVFWITDAVGLPTNFLIVWEVFRHTFPKGSSLSRIASKGFVLAGFGLTIFLIDAFWGFKAYAIFNSVYLALDRSFGFASAVLTMSLVFVARYYDLPLGQNVWGIAVGFGGWASILTANNAIFDLDHTYIPFWRILSPVSFMAMLGVWIWAMWNYAPNPAIEVEGGTASHSDLRAWTDEWDRTVSASRRIIHP